jgi:hypothetical protein
VRARQYADDAWSAPPQLRPERPNYAPLLIEAVAAALEEFDAPPVHSPLAEPQALLESSLAPLVELSLADLEGEPGEAPPVQLPADMLAALADAA